MSRAYNFHSTDLGAPTLAGVAGAGITLLDALLINGYGVTSVSGITRSGGTVTVTTGVDHGKLFEDVIEIAGADQTDYNGKWKVLTVPTSKTLTFDIGPLTPTTPATGTITVKKAGLGWTKAFSDTNRAAYKMPIGSNGFYLYVDDTTTTYMSVCIYETMSDIDTGTNPTPALATTSVWNKSSTANSTTRPWAAYGDEYWLWFAPCYNATFSTRAAVFGAGDLIKVLSTDGYATAIIVCTSTVTTGADSTGNFRFLQVNSSTSSGDIGHYLVRASTQLGSAVAAGKVALATTLLGGNGIYPYDAAAGVMLTDVFMHDTTGPQIRGRLPCLKTHQHTAATYNPTTYTRLPPVPELSGQTLETCSNTYGGSAYSVIFNLTDSGR